MPSHINPPSNRRFGVLFASVFGGLAAYTAYRGAAQIVVHAWLVAGSMVGMIAFCAPKLLAPFNIAWMRLGHLMGRIVSPLVLGIIFFVLITPIALLTRLFGRDELRLKKANVSSYWIDRVPPGPAGESFKNQF